MAEPTRQDPFVAARSAKVAGSAPPLPAARLRELGATDDELHAATVEWAGLTPEQQTLAAAMMAEQSDDDVREAIEDDRVHAWADAEVEANRYPSRGDAFDALLAAGEWLAAVAEQDEQRQADMLATLQQWATDLVRSGEYPDEAAAAAAISAYLSDPDAQPVTLTGVVTPPEPDATGSGSDGAAGAGSGGGSGPAPDQSAGESGAGGGSTVFVPNEPVADLVPDKLVPADGYPEGGGTVSGVLAWIGGGADEGDRRARAVYALQQEAARPEGSRSTLIEAATKIAGD